MSCIINIGNTAVSHETNSILDKFAIYFHLARRRRFRPIPGLARINLTYSAMSAATRMTWVAKDTGIFYKHSRDVGLVCISGDLLRAIAQSGFIKSVHRG